MTADQAAADPSATRHQAPAGRAAADRVAVDRVTVDRAAAERLAADRAAAIESAVLAATERLLAQGSSFATLSTQRIADEAGVARSTLYLYFKEKNALLVRLTAGLKDGAYDLMNRWSPDEQDALDRLDDTLLGVIRYYRQRAHVLRAVLELAGQDSGVSHVWDDELGPFQRLSQGWIERAQASGQTAADIDAATASQVIVHGGIRVITQQALSGSPERDAKVARELAANQWFGAFRRARRGP
jgi:AcrR family transcriptional regulator